MEMILVQISIIRGSLTLVGLSVVLSGCQRYQPRSLDPEEHRARWLERSPQSAGVVEFAQQLADSGDPVSEYDPSDGITCAEAELIALVFNPELRLARLRAGVTAATAEHAGLWDDPEFSIDFLRITESVSTPWVITPGLAFTIPISGRLEVEKSRADAALRAELTRVAEDEWRVRHEVRQIWLAWSAALLRAQETSRLIESMGGLTDSTTRLAEAGELPRTEAALFVIERSQRQQERTRLEGEAAVAEQRLRMLLGLSPSAPLELLPSIDLPNDSVEGREIASSLELRQLREEYEVAEHALHREIRKQYPDLTIGPLYETDQGQSRIGFLGAIPLPILNANRQGIAEATAERELAHAAFETTAEQLEGSLAVARAESRMLRAEYEELASVIGPMIDRQVSDATRLVELGEGGGLVLLESLIRSHDTKLNIIDLRRELALAAAEEHFLLGPEWQTTESTPASADANEGEVTQ
ncbi:MAG: hypothetical protein CMJ27_04390 [Phycisphaerae bacterium]|nr:hypothetical protein [Phycisphaerae bacterium]